MQPGAAALAFLIVVLVVPSTVWSVDCNGNHVQDAMDIDEARSVDCNANRIPDECEVWPAVFGPREVFPVESEPVVLVVADVNGDEVPDLITGNQSPTMGASLSVLLGGGDGEFSPARSFAAGDDLVSIALDDVDGDGIPDVIVAGKTSVTWLRNLDGVDFAAPAVLVADQSTSFLSTGDFNGDARADLVIVDGPSNSFALLTNQGDGSFGLASNYDLGRDARAATVGDLDGDGSLDLAVAIAGSDSIAVFLNDGTGALGKAVDYESGTTKPFGTVVADFDRDGSLDLACGGQRTMGVLTNEGGGAFSSPRPFRILSQLWRWMNSIEAADVDGDGDVDLVGAFSSALSLFVVFNDGDGNFRSSHELFDSRSESRSLVAADLNEDGEVDFGFIDVERGGVAVRKNVLRTTGPPLSFRGPNRYRLLGDPHGADSGDIDGDGDIDVVAVNNCPFHGVSVLKNQGDGTFGELARYSTDGWLFAVVLQDFDLDGDLDLGSGSVRDATFQVIMNDGTGDFSAEPINHHSGGSHFHITAADLDGDLDFELIGSQGSLAILWNQGAGNFDLTRPNVGNSTQGVAPGDFDEDGDIDLALAHSSISAVSVLLNRGDGSFAPRVVLPVSGRPGYVETADIDGDGHLDLAVGGSMVAESVARSKGSTASVLWNTGQAAGGDDASGLFGNLVGVRLNHNPYSLTLADLNGDGRSDLLLANALDDSFSVITSRGDRTFSMPTEYRVKVEPRLVIAADVNGDGNIDPIVLPHDSGVIAVFYNTGAKEYLETICTEVDFTRVAVVGRADGAVESAGKYVVPARDDPTLLPTLFQNAQRFPLHEEFLRSRFPERFGNLSTREYDELVGRRDSRDYFVGAISRVRSGDGILYAFTIFADTGSDVDEVLKLNEVQNVYETLSESFGLRPLAYQPDTELAKRQAEGWTERPFPVFFGEDRPDLEYEAYTLATGFGRVRLLTLEEFEAANDSGRFTFQDILVIGDAPRDIEGVVGGVITARRQGELSHVAIRTSRRRTPNAFVLDALNVLAPHDGKLVRLQVFPDRYFVDEVSLEEANEFWAANRQKLEPLPTVDTTYTSLDSLSEMDLSGVGEQSPVSRFGGKASNLARLQRVLGGEFAAYREVGFGIPMRHYLDFMNTNRATIGEVELTYQAYLDQILSSPEFQSDSARRFELLEDFRDLIRENGEVDPQLIQQLVQRIEAVFGSTTRMVRFRSSSNVEDGLVFSGAGLYESTSACAQDTVDVGSPDGSHCDPTRDNERTIERAIKKVWASLWTFRAVEERTFFQIPPENAAMGILVSRAFPDEIANGVALSGNPNNPLDRRYTITVQVGEESVVSPEPGTSVERNLLEVVDGQVIRIFRDRASNLVEPGRVVISDDHLHELGALMWHVDQNFPVDLDGHEREEVLLDFEFKVEPDGSLAVKQVRPFLLSAPPPPSPTFSLEIPPASVVCGVFSKDRVDREPEVEWSTKSIVELVDGTIELPTTSQTFSADLIREVRFGPEQLVAQPRESGLIRVVRVPDTIPNQIKYRFIYQQEFELPTGERFDIEITGLNFKGRGDVPIEETLRFDDEFLTFDISMTGFLAGTPVTSYSSCGYELLPRWKVSVAFGSASSFALEQRFLPSPGTIDTGPASVVGADVVLEGKLQVVNDYWRLVYAARRHNRNVRYWAVLDPPLSFPGVSVPVHVVELESLETVTEVETEAQVRLLDRDFQVVAEPATSAFSVRQVDERAIFVRGDVDADGSVNLADAISLLNYLFRRGPSPPCSKALDVDDSGRLNVTDPINVLRRLFQGGPPLPSPSSECGEDPTADSLSCEAFPRCG